MRSSLSPPWYYRRTLIRDAPILYPIPPHVSHARTHTHASPPILSPIAHTRLTPIASPSQGSLRLLSAGPVDVAHYTENPEWKATDDDDGDDDDDDGDGDYGDDDCDGDGGAGWQLLETHDEIEYKLYS